jgi:molecular chaperone DnaK
VTPLTLGIKVEGDLMVPLIPRNMAIPTKKSQTFSTARDDQSGVTVEVYQGERPMADDNRKLGNFDLAGILPAPRGLPQIEVTFDIDASGILNVSAKDLATGKSHQIRVTAGTGLDEKGIEKMLQDAEAYKEKDRERKQMAEARNEADHAIYSTEKMLHEHADKLGSTDKEKIGTALETLKKVKDGGDAGATKRALEAVHQASHDFAKTLYENAAKERAGAAEPRNGTSGVAGVENPDGEPRGEKVIDADFTTKS